MMSSAVHPAGDDRPAVPSAAWVEAIRDDIGFRGVLISDALDTPSLAAYGTVGDVAARAARVGVDLFIASEPGACDAVRATPQAAIEANAISYESAAASYGRVEALRSRLSRAPAAVQDGDP